MDDTHIVKRIQAIGAELVDLESKRNEIDNRTKKLLSEVHRLSRPRGVTSYDGEVEDEEPLPAAAFRSGAGPHFVRNGEPTLRAKMVRWMGEVGKTVTKYEVAQGLGVTPMQVQYAFVGLAKHGLVESAGRGVMALTERGKAEASLPPATTTVLVRPQEVPRQVVDEKPSTPALPSDTR